ncbi:MAG TPA: hypothetical protein VHZ55_00890 [Bryobacteraceae bacterium]|nr:hypothetical protein [Bryobacteraceae bacterium]
MQQQYRNSFTQGQSEAFNKFAPEKQQKLLDQRTPLFVQRQNNASVDSHLQGLKSKVDQHLADPDVSEKDKQELKSHWGSAQESVKNAGHMSDEKEKASFYGEARKHVGNVDSKVGQLDNQKTRRDEFDKGRPDYKVFPHGGKHDPSTNKKVGPRPTDKELIAGTANGKAALYKTSNAREVNGMEKEAWVKGHELGDNFTAVHKMSQNVGASDGEMTPYIRMDGAHHGHPITQKEFKTKMQKDIDGAKTAGDQKKLDQIRQYLTSIKEEPQFKS